MNGSGNIAGEQGNPYLASLRRLGCANDQRSSKVDSGIGEGWILFYMTNSEWWWLWSLVGAPFEPSAEHTLVYDLSREAPPLWYPELASGLCECLLDTVVVDTFMSFLYDQGSQWVTAG